MAGVRSRHMTIATGGATRNEPRLLVHGKAEVTSPRLNISYENTSLHAGFIGGMLTNSMQLIGGGRVLRSLGFD